MEQGVDGSPGQGCRGAERGVGRRYEMPVLVSFGRVGELTFGPAGALTDAPEAGYSFAE